MFCNMRDKKYQDEWSRPEVQKWLPVRRLRYNMSAVWSPEAGKMLSLFFYYYHKKIFVYIEQGTSSYRKLSDWLLPLDVDIAQRVKEKNIFFIAVLCPSQALLCICLLSPLELNAFIIIWWGKHARKHAISLYFDQNLSCLSSTIKPSANVLPRPWMINTLSCNVLLMSHRNRASPLPGVSLL